MSAIETRLRPTCDEAMRFLQLAEAASGARDVDEFAERVIPILAEIMKSSSVLLYLYDQRLLDPRIFHYGFDPSDKSEVEALCAEQFQRISSAEATQPLCVRTSAAEKLRSNLLYPLQGRNNLLGFLGASPQFDMGLTSISFSGMVLRFVSNTIDSLADRVKSERQLSYLNTYLSVSSMLAQPLGLNDLLETILYTCVEAASAQEASVLLLDEEKKNFYFYQVEGSSKSLLMGATFPADKGLAGAVLQSQQSEIVNDVRNDPRFYGRIDSDSGFKTRNLIAIPLTAGEERIGILEVVNKTNGEAFAEEEHLLLLSIAEEIAFAIRNAKVFDYVVNTYCKQRQGLPSCKGCKRPLGSWTPCVKYREAMM